MDPDSSSPAPGADPDVGAAAARDAVERSARVPEAAPSDFAQAFEGYHAKLFEMMRANVAATGHHVAALLGARSVPEAVALNADHLRRRLEAMAGQGRELATLAQKLTLEALQPPRGPTARDR